MAIPFHEDFPHDYRVRLLAARPAILPVRYFVYPKLVDEIEKEALLLEISPNAGASWTGAFALGFAEPSVVTGAFSCPNPCWICVIAGGYAYLVNASAPAEFVHLRPRPVTQALPVAAVKD